MYKKSFLGDDKRSHVIYTMSQAWPKLGTEYPYNPVKPYNPSPLYLILIFTLLYKSTTFTYQKSIVLYNVLEYLEQ